MTGERSATGSGASRRTPVLLWDIDGTLLRRASGSPRGAGATIDRRDIFSQATGCPSPFDARSIPHGRTDRWIIEAYVRAEHPGADPDPAVIDRMLLDLGELTVARRPVVHRDPVEGVFETLAEVVELGFVNALLTGNTPARAFSKLSTAGFDLGGFDLSRSSFGDASSDRLQVARTARDRSPGAPLVVIGDTEHDAQAAREISAAFIGVAEGLADLVKLEALGMGPVVCDLRGAAVLIASLLAHR